MTVTARRSSSTRSVSPSSIGIVLDLGTTHNSALPPLSLHTYPAELADVSTSWGLGLSSRRGGTRGIGARQRRASSGGRGGHGTSGGVRQRPFWPKVEGRVRVSPIRVALRPVCSKPDRRTRVSAKLVVAARQNMENLRRPGTFPSMLRPAHTSWKAPMGSAGFPPNARARASTGGAGTRSPIDSPSFSNPATRRTRPTPATQPATPPQPRIVAPRSDPPRRSVVI